jgi:hypothetical protein
MPNSELLKKLQKAVEAQRAVQAAAKGIKAEIERLKSES